MPSPLPLRLVAASLFLLAAPGALRFASRGATRWVEDELARRRAAEARVLAKTPPPDAAVSWEVFAVRAEPDRVFAIARTVRLVIEGGSWRAARERPRDPIVAAAGGRGRWLFATATGEYFSSESFDGPLVFLGRGPRSGGVYHPSAGRLVLEDREGGLWSTDGTAAPARLEAAEALMTAAFVDARRGAAIARGGTLLLTDDGGESWRESPLGNDAAYAFAWEHRGLCARTAWGTTVLAQAAPDETRERLSPEEQALMAKAGLANPRLHLRVVPAGDVSAWRSKRQWARAFLTSVAELYGSGTPGSRFDEDDDEPSSSASLAWSPPDFSLGGPGQGSAHGGGLSTWGARDEPLATRRDFTRVDARFTAAPIAVTLRGSGTEARALLHWRGVDDRGAFSGAADVAVAALERPPEPPDWGAVATAQATSLVLAGVTRTGALLGRATRGDQVKWYDRLWWVGDGARRVECGAGPLRQAAVVPMASGGALVFTASHALPGVHALVCGNCEDVTVHEPFQARVYSLMELSAEGAVLRRRAWVWSARQDGYVGPAETTTGWAVLRAVRDAHRASRLRLYPLDGDASAELPSPEAPEPPRACPRSSGAPPPLRVVWLRPEGSLAGWPRGWRGLWNFDGATRVDFEVSGGALCVRRVDGARELYDEAPGGADPRWTYASSRRVQAFSVRAAGARLEGIVDDGRRVGRARGRIERWEPSAYDYDW